MKLLELGISSVKPMSPTKMATIENLFKTMSGFLKEIDEIEKKSQGNMISMLKATKETFSESIEDFKSLNLDDKLLLLAQNSFRSGLVCINVLKKSLKKEVTSEIRDLLEKSGLLCLVA